jgi:hypothetical protein
VAEKFYLEITPPGTIIQGHPRQVDSSTTQSGLTIAVPIPLSAEEINLSDALFELVEVVWRPQGWGYHYPACAGSNHSSTTSDGRLDELEANVLSQPSMTYPVSVPSGPGQDSVYDFIGNFSLALSLAAANAGLVGGFASVQSGTGNYINVSPVNLETSLKLILNDGSSGIWRFNAEQGRWEPDWSTFEDSDSNPIPVTEADLPPGISAWFSATDQGQDNLQNFLERAAMFGIPITGPGGDTPGDKWPVRCDVTNEGITCYYQ